MSGSAQAAAAMETHFGKLTDPRRRESTYPLLNPTYPLLNMVVMTLCAVIGGADEFVAIARWARTRRDWLAKFLDMSAGVPSHDRFNAVLGALRPGEGVAACTAGGVMATIPDSGAAPIRPRR